MELYVAYKDYNWMMNLVEEMVKKVALDIYGKTEVQVGSISSILKNHGKGSV